MRYLTLEARRDDFDDSLGFVLGGTPHFEDLMADRTGEMIPHDVLEHQNGPHPMGEVWDELQAVGAGWYVRGRTGDMASVRPNIHSPVTNWAADVTRMSDYHVVPPPPTRALKDYEDDLDDILEEARHDIIRYHDCPDPDAYLAKARGHMRIGFRKARRRYRNKCAHAQFVAIRDAVARAIPMLDFENQLFTLSYGDNRADVTERFH